MIVNLYHSCVKLHIHKYNNLIILTNAEIAYKAMTYENNNH